MKILGQLPVVKEVSASKPYGAIIDETDTNDGTPVVRALYNDIITNLYKALELAGIIADGTEDGETDGEAGIPKYQLLEALRKIPNLLNDIEQVLTLTGTTWSVPFDLSLLPDKYIFIGRATDNYVSGTFIGDNVSPSYSFTSSGFSASDLVLTVIDQSGVRAYGLGSGSSGSGLTDVFTTLGTPIQSNDSSTLYYQESGYLLTDIPSSNYIEETLKNDIGSIEISLIEMFVYQEYLLCVVFDSGNVTYLFRQFPLGDLSASEAVTISGAVIPVGTDNEPYFYFDSGNVYITNQYGSTSVYNDLSTFIYNSDNATLTLSTTNTLNPSFVKTTNSVVKSGLIYVLINGSLKSHNILTSAVSDYGVYSGIVGNLFGYLGNVYHTTGEVGKKWA